MTRTVSRLIGAQVLLVLLAALCGAAIGYYLLFSHPKYSAKSMLYITPPASSSPTDAAMGDQYAANRTQLYLELVKSNDLAERVAAELQSSESPSAVASKVKATGLHQAPLVEIEATASTSDGARSLAQAYADQFPEFAKLIEQNSGIREGPVIVPVESPVEVTKNTAGWKPWLKFVAFTLAGAAVALAFVLWCRHRHPTARNIGALRQAMQPSVVEEVRGDPDGVMRVQAMLFAAPNSARRVIFATARDRDRLEEFTAGFAGSLQGNGIHSVLVTAEKLDDFQNGSPSNDIIVYDAPALLEKPEPMGALAMRSSTAVIVARGRTTLVADVVELGRLLELNGIGVRAILSVRGGRWKGSERPSSDVPSAADDSDGHPWPSIEGLEAAMSSRNERKAFK